MAKSLIRTVDGIGIWVRDNDVYKDEPPGIREIISIFANCFICLLVVFYTYKLINPNDFITIFFSETGICMLVFCCLLTLESFGGLVFRSFPAYEIYPGTESGITVFKTTPDGDPINKADQLAICKAAQEIESRCHEIAAKRAELDRIAAGCK